METDVFTLLLLYVLCYFGAANLLHSYWHILAIAASLYVDDLLNLAFGVLHQTTFTDHFIRGSSYLNI